MQSKFVGCLLLFFAVAGLIGSAVSYVYTSGFVSRAIEAPAKVTALATSRGEDGPMYCPVFSFTRQDGQEQTFTSKHCSSPSRASVGDTTSVLYDPQEPQSARENTFFGIWWLSIVLAAFAGIDFVVGAIILVFGSRR